MIISYSSSVVQRRWLRCFNNGRHQPPTYPILQEATGGACKNWSIGYVGGWWWFDCWFSRLWHILEIPSPRSQRGPVIECHHCACCRLPQTTSAGIQSSRVASASRRTFTVRSSGAARYQCGRPVIVARANAICQPVVRCPRGLSSHPADGASCQLPHTGSAGIQWTRVAANASCRTPPVPGSGTSPVRASSSRHPPTHSHGGSSPLVVSARVQRCPVVVARLEDDFPVPVRVLRRCSHRDWCVYRCTCGVCLTVIARIINGQRRLCRHRR